MTRYFMPFSMLDVIVIVTSVFKTVVFNTDYH